MCGPWGQGKKSGPSPVDRGRPGSKHHLLTDAGGVPLAIVLTSAGRQDITQLLTLVDAIPQVAGRPGHPRHRPESLYADRAYDSEPHREELRSRGIRPHLPRRHTGHGSGLGTKRWVVERTIAWLHQFRRLRVRFERRADLHEGLLHLGCALICWRLLGASF
jgi:transposase